MTPGQSMMTVMAPMIVVVLMTMVMMTMMHMMLTKALLGSRGNAAGLGKLRGPKGSGSGRAPDCGRRPVRSWVGAAAARSLPPPLAGGGWHWATQPEVGAPPRWRR